MLFVYLQNNFSKAILNSKKQFRKGVHKGRVENCRARNRIGLQLNNFKMHWNIVLFVLTTVFCAALAEHTRVKRRMYAMCPPSFKRIGSECYFISSARLNWLDAHFECKDKNSKLAEPGKIADRKLRVFLMAMDTDPDEIWIGGAYDWNTYKWHWGYNGKEITYQSFSQMDPGSSQDLRYHCAVLNPSIKYRWSARSCVDRHRFICQHKMPRVSEKNRVKVYNRWNETYPNQLANEVLLEIIDNGENETRRRQIIRVHNETYEVECNVRRVTHRRVKAVGSTDTFTIPVRRRPIRRRGGSSGGSGGSGTGRRPQQQHHQQSSLAASAATERYQGIQPYPTLDIRNNDVSVINGHLGTHDVRDSVAQFAPDSNGFKSNLNGHVNGISNNGQERPRGGGGRNRSRQHQSTDPSIETNETIQHPNKTNKPRQRTLFDREIELKRRRALQRRKKMEQHRKWKQEQREKARKEKKEQERLRQEEENERLRQAAEREAERRERMEDQREEKRKQMEELEALKQQQLEELEKERQQAELAQKRRQQIESEQNEVKEKQEKLETEKKRQAEEKRRQEKDNESKMLKKQQEYEEEMEMKRNEEEHRIMIEYEEKARKEERLQELEQRKRLEAEEEERRKREEEYKKLEEEQKREERRRQEEELARLEEEERIREERQKAREDKIRRREELLRQQEEEEKRLQIEMQEREKAERLARLEEERRKEEERKQKEEEEQRKQAEKEEKRRQKELQKHKNDSKIKEKDEEAKRLKLQKLRERLNKLSPEEQKKFFEMRRKRKQQNSDNESIIPEYKY